MVCDSVHNSFSFSTHASISMIHLCSAFCLSIFAGFDEEVSDRDLAIIARDFLNDWKVLRPFLGLSRSKETQICQLYPSNNVKQRHECLEVWKETEGEKATYHALIRAAKDAQLQSLADGVIAIVHKQPCVLPPHSKGANC